MVIGHSIGGYTALASAGGKPLALPTQTPDGVAHPVEVERDPRIGAVSGDIAPRNSHASVITQFQEIEYLQSISIGKRIADALNQVVCVSGAFGAFRRTALDDIGGFDVGGGEDLDMTIRLRLKGWQVAYAPEAVCYTDVPETVYQYIRQRLRWERDAIWIRFRKHPKLMNPFSPDFRLGEAIHQWDFILFNVIGALAWGVGVTMLGFWLGSFDFVRRNIEVALILVVAVSLIPMGVEWVRHRRERSREDAGLDAA